MNEELENLLKHCVEYASDLLVETGESYPFGAFIDTIGNVHPLEMEIDTKNVPTIGQVIENLKGYCEGEMKASKMNGYALAYEVALQLEEGQDKIDAISIDMKHIENEEPPLFYLPFKLIEPKKGEPGEIFGVKR
ncbi:hypothetical protein [Crocinitomix algicola]|uniref:hypothetical protein n=1 Tax=Crocinitomix algicola TaxID=1740263 RepID=UPI00087329CE|nr:hypothetical protein [Crocinitomix algicola]